MEEAQGPRAVVVVPRAVAVSHSSINTITYATPTTYIMLLLLQCPRTASANLVDMASPAWVVALVCRRGATSAGLVIARRGRKARQVGEYAAGGA